MFILFVRIITIYIPNAVLFLIILLSMIIQDNLSRTLNKHSI